MQLLVLAAGLAGSATIAVVLVTVTASSNPIWVLPVIVAGIVCFAGLLATSGWSMRALVDGHLRPRISGGVYLTALLTVGGVVAWSNDTPLLAHLLPLGLAALVGVVAVAAGMRRRSWGGRVNRLRSGAHVRGTVTDDGLSAFPDSPHSALASIAIRFRDYSGADRWVTVPAKQSSVHPIAPGDQVDVWFDPSRPDDASAILVEHDNGSSHVIAGGVRGSKAS